MENLKKLWILSLFVLLASGCRGPQAVMAQQGTTVTMQTFYNELAPYGQWITDPTYGYVWVPDVEPGFQPYATRGHWVMTQYGNTWVSDYDWGWGPFHYGRWNYDAYYGWLWVPGLEWGPAWVAWRSGGGYYGWAPLGPGMAIRGRMHLPPAHWCFVPQRYITSPRLYSYYAPAPRVVNIYQNTTIINNYYTTNNRTYVQGPQADEIRQHTRRDVQVYQVNDQPRPSRTEVRNRTVNLYRPDVAAGRNDAPTRVANRDNLAPRTGRPADSRPPVGSDATGRSTDTRNSVDESDNFQRATRVRPVPSQTETARPAPTREQRTGREAAPQSRPRPSTPEANPRTTRPERVESAPRPTPQESISQPQQVRKQPRQQAAPQPRPQVRERATRQQTTQPQAQPAPQQSTGRPSDVRGRR